MKTTSYKLIDVCKMQSGGTPRRGTIEYYDGNILWAKIGDIENAKNGLVDTTEEKITANGLAAIRNRLFPKNTVLLAMYGSVGKVAIAGCELSTNQAILGLTPDEEKLDYKFLAYWLKFKKNALLNEARGVALQNISKTIVAKQVISLPSVAEQQRIVSLLDQADALRRKRKESIKLLDEYVQAVFMEMFGDPVTNPKRWSTKPVGDLIDFMTSGSRGWAKYYSNSGEKFLRIQNVTKNKLKLDDLAFINAPDTAEAHRTRVQKGDVLLSITADLGRTAVIPEGFGTAHISQHLALLRLKPSFSPFFVSAFLSSAGGMYQINKLNKGGVKAGLNFNDVKSIKVPMPPIELQTAYERNCKDAELVLSKMLDQQLEIENQFNAHMQKTFSPAA